jgi:STE24 endopeptidase
MPFVYLLVFALISFQGGAWPTRPEWLDAYGIALAPWTMAAVFCLLSAWRVHYICRQLGRQTANHGLMWRRYQRGNRRQVLLLTACYLSVLYLGWGQLVQNAGRAMELTALTKLMQFSPFLLALVLCWSQFYRAERASHQLAGEEPFEGLWEYLLLQIRQNLLLVVPLVFLSIAMESIFQLFPSLQQEDSEWALAGLALLPAALIVVPFILRVFLGLRPLPAGPLRDRLEASARRLGLSFSDVLIWDTRRCVANAMVSGALPWLRYIVLTDLLIEKLTPDEVEAVFGHEVGHIKHHHMLLYILFFVGSLAMLTGVWKYCENALTPVAPAIDEQVAEPYVWPLSGAVLGGPALLAMVSVYVFVVFGFLSRRCERQADLYGCRAVSSAAFISALDKVAYLNGIPRQRTSWLTSWQHPSIAQRVEFIERLRDNPTLEPHFQRSLWRLKLGLMTALTVGLVLVAWNLGPDRVWDLFRVR